MHFVIKLFPEIIVKSPPVRKRMTRQLGNNLTKLLKPMSDEIKVKVDWDRVDINGPENNELIARVSEVLTNTPGIANFSLVHKYPLGDFDDMFHKTKALWADRLVGKTFCVRAKRTGNHSYNSTEVEQYVGGGLNQHTEAAGVKLKKPDVTVKLEIRNDEFFVLDDVQQGLGGFPLGSQDTVMSLISGGFDSNVASYLTMKRGLRTHFLFFNLGGRAHEVGVKEVAYFLWSKYGASHRVKFITVPFEEVVAEILESVSNSQMGVILKRMMLRAASQVAEELNVEGLVTGESVAQVSSQTLANLSIIDKVTDTLVLRPLITSNKNDIIKISREIGTEEFSANMPEYCGVISVKPTTRARMEKIEAEEARFDFDVLDKAIECKNSQNIDELMDESSDETYVEVMAAPLAGAVVLDIRHPDEEEQSPLKLDGVQIQKLPFFRLGKKFKELDVNTRYMLYCDKGIMSRLHAELLFESGHANVLVYRPGKK